jgi:hypothetical protein
MTETLGRVNASPVRYPDWEPGARITSAGICAGVPSNGRVMRLASVLLGKSGYQRWKASFRCTARNDAKLGNLLYAKHLAKLVD